jgi:hypothetical protein
MKTNLLVAMACLFVGLTCHSLSAQEDDDSGETGVYGYTTIYYDPSTLKVSAFSETELNGTAPYYYDAQVNLSSNGYNDNVTSSQPGSSISAYITYQGATGTTYSAYGLHYAVISSQFYEHIDNDFYGMENWASYDVLSEFNYPFTAFSPDTFPSNQPIFLGETTDYAQATIPSSCGDIRTTIVQEYVSYHTPYNPQCSEFTQTSTDPLITFAQLNSGSYTWAIIRSYFLTQLDQVHTQITGDHLPFTINSAYRNPATEFAVVTALPGGVYRAGSRHQYGDAIDLATTSTTWATFQQIGHQYKACVEPLVAQKGSTGHSHLDWRTLATVGVHFVACPPGW